MARPTKRTPEVEARLFDALRAGNTRRAACVYAGISDETLANWCRRSLDFLDALRRAEAHSEVALVALIRQHAREDWRAAGWLLERRWPTSWARRDRDPDIPPTSVNVRIVERQVLIQQVAGALERYPDAREDVLHLLQSNGHAEP
jgi:hypothetical protein